MFLSPLFSKQSSGVVGNFGVFVPTLALHHLPLIIASLHSTFFPESFKRGPPSLARRHFADVSQIGLFVSHSVLILERGEHCTEKRMWTIARKRIEQSAESGAL